MVTVEVEGIEEAVALLEEVSEIVATRAYVNGLDAAGEVIEAELWPRVPQKLDPRVIGNRAHGGHGALVANITRVIEADSHGRGGVMDIGFGNLGHVALWVEYGHRQVRGGRLRKDGSGGRITGNVRPHPFMRPAFDASKERAIDAFVEGVKRTLKGLPGYSPAA